ATHRNLEQRVKDGAFREDLYFRLAVVPLAIPPLRDRRDDVAGLLDHFLTAVAQDLKVARKTIAPEAVAALKSYPFPGNVRELRNLIERAYILGRGEELRIEDFPVANARSSKASAPPSDSAEDLVRALPQELDARSFLDDVERQLLIRALDASGGAQAEAARRLGLSRSDMTYKVKKYGIRDHTSQGS
ncbi:MAG: sigma 54-interacting transcriptional regulator, partial [Candidatus Hydrogenedentes bacterium]|nr:sigma 54-interacting transcriptional regulator [Candidatus Hydrogenedentota bacterium]